VEKKLSGLVVNSYGYANFSLSIMLSLGTMYYMKFLTDTAMISAALAGVIMLVGGGLDTASIFISGSIIQKTQMRWGRFRSWFLFIPITTAVFFTLSFSNLPLSNTLKVIYLTVAYILGHVSLNFAFNAHIGFISVLTKDVNERLRISIRNIQFGMASQIFFSLGIIKLLEYLKVKLNPSWAFFYIVVILSIIQIIGYWNLFYQTKGYEKYDPNLNTAPSSKITLLEIIKQIGSNSQLLILMASDVMNQTMIFSIMGLAIYFLDNIAGNAAWMSNHTLITSILSFITAMYAPYIIRLFGKKNTYIIAMVWGSAFYFVLRLFGDLSVIHFTLIICLGNMIFGTAGPMRQAMYMDAAEYGFYKTGKDASAFTMSMFTLPIKIGITLSGAIIGFGLSLIGYIPGTAVTEEVAGNLMDIICYIPAGCGIIAMVLMLFYRLNDKNLLKIMEANNLKRAAAKV
jgi:glycoside/pentoside/hexuronide:cation symporter, GPH family